MGYRRLSDHAFVRRLVRLFLVLDTSFWHLSILSHMGSVLAQKKESFSRLTQVGIEAALQAGEILKSGFGTNYSISFKEGRHNLVTEYDHKAEASILSILKKNYSQSDFLAEESGLETSSSDLLWIIDPLDGTVNFAHKIPFFSVSIGLEIQGILQSGIVYQPMTQELFVAERGKGAFLNGQPIHVSSISQLQNAMLSTGFPYNLSDNPFHCIDHFIDVLKLGIPIRRLGSAALDLAYTAAGRIEGFFEVGLQPWDVSAGLLLIQEAGGSFSNWRGEAFQLHKREPLFASNGKIHGEMTTLLNRAP